MLEELNAAPFADSSTDPSSPEIKESSALGLRTEALRKGILDGSDVTKDTSDKVYISELRKTFFPHRELERQALELDRGVEDWFRKHS